MANEIDPFAYNPELDAIFGTQQPTDIEEPDLSQYLPQEQPTRETHKRSAQKAGGEASQYDALINELATARGQDPNLIKAQIWAESGFNPNAVSPKGARGLSQFMPGTWAKYGKGDPHDPRAAIEAQLNYNEFLGKKFGGDTEKMLAAYNWGENRKGLQSDAWRQTAPAETRDYVQKILRKHAEYSGGAAPTGSYGEPDISQDPEFLKQFQQQENPLAGTYAIPLSNGQMLHAPEGMDRNEAIAQARSMGVEAEGLKDIHLANGQILHAPDSMDEAEAIAQAKALKPDMDFTTKAQAEHAAKQGMGPAAAAGLHGALGQLATGAGEWTEDANILKQPSDWLKQKGAELSKKAAEEYAPLTKEEAAAQGPLGYAKKYFAEPLAQGAAGIVPLAGAYAVPGIGPVLGTAALATQETGALAQEAQQEGREFTKAGALPTIAGATALNYLGIKHLGPLRKAFGEEFSAGERAAVKAAINEGGFEAAQQVVGSKLGNIAKNVGISSGAFASGDIGTRVLERIYADKPVADDDALKEYGDILTQDLPLGVVAGAGRGYMAHGEKAAALDKSGAEMRAAAPRPMPGEETVAEAPELTATAEPEHTPETADILAKARAAEQAQQEAPITEVPEPPVEEPHFSESILGLKPHSGLAKKLKGLDINNPEDHPQIDEILSKTRVDIPAENLNALEARMAEVKPPEVTSAEQIPETSAPNGSGVPQPQVRKESRGPSISGERVQPSGQGIETPEVKAPEEKIELPKALEKAPLKAPEVEKAPLKAPEVEKAPLTTPKPTEVTAAHEMFEDARNLAETHPKEVDADLLAAEEDRARMAREGFKPEDYDEDSYLYAKAEEPTHIEVNGTKRPVHDSTGQRIHTTDEGVKNFWKGFEGTKVTDEEGRPIKVYHGTDKTFTEFKPSKTGTLGQGMYFALDKNAAKEWAATHKGAKIEEAYLNVKNPYKIDSTLTATEQLWDKFGATSDADLINKLRKSGYDGIWAVGSGETKWGTTKPEIVVFDPEQIKSAIGNVGKFDTTKPDIREARGAAPEAAHSVESLNDHIVKTYGKNAPQVEVLTREQAGVEPNVKGFYDPNTKKVALIADNIGKGEDLHGLVRHEVAVHARRMGKTEPEFQHMLNRLQELKDSGAKDVIKAYESVPKDTKPEHVHEEALAYLVHKAPHLPLVKRFMSWLRRAAHKVTGDHSWLKSDDFGKMADDVLKRRVEVPTRGATAERMYAKEPSATEQALRDLKVHATGKEKSSKERVDTHIENTQRTHNKWEEWYNRHIRQPFVAKDSFLSMVLKNEADFDAEGKASANVKRAQASQTAQIINNANKMGHVVHDPQSGLVKIVQSDLNPEALRERAHKETDPEAFGAAMSIMAMRGHQKRHEAAGKAIEAFDADRKLLDKFVKSLPEESPDRTAANKAAAELRVKIASLKKRYDAIEDKGGMHPDITPEKVALAERYFKENEAAGKLRDDYLQMFRNDAKLLRDTGVISDAAHKEFTKEEYHYVPLYKTLEDLETDVPKVEILSGGPSAIKGPKKKGVGGHEINFFENVITHQIRMVSAAIENNARLSTLKSLEGLGEAKEMHQGWTPSQNPNAMVVRVNDGGAQKTYVVDDKAVYEAFQTIRQLPIPDFITNFTKEFSRFALMNPAYWWRQLVREPFMANFTARTGIITPYHTIKEFGSLLLGGQDATARKLYDQMRSQGITGSHEYLRNAQITHGKIFEDKGRLTATKDAVGSGLSKWAKIHEMADAATKVAVMKKALKQAQREGYTGEQAKDVAIHKVRDMINFANMGNAKSVRILNQTIPFFNSWAQGLDALVRNATGMNMSKAQAAQARKLFWGRAMTMVAASMAYSYMMASTSKAYQDANEEDVYNNWLIPIPEELGADKARMLKMAAPFEIGAVFKALPEFFVRRFMGLDKDKEFKDVAANQFWKNIAPPGLESAFIPQVLKPIIESTTGKTVSIRGKGIPVGNQFIAPELRGRGDSPLADSIADVTGLSPAAANNMMRGYFAEVYSGMDAIAKGVQAAMASPTARADLRDITEKVPFAKGFLTNPNKLDQTSAYDFMNEVKTAKASATYAGKRGMPEAKEYAKKGAASGAVAKMETTLSTLNAAIENLKNQPNNPAIAARRDTLLESKKKVLESIERMKERLNK